MPPGAAGMDALCATQGDRLVVILGGATDADKAASASSRFFGDGPVVVGPAPTTSPRPTLSARAALSGAPRRRRAGPTPRDRWPPTTCCPSGPWPATATPAATSSRRSSCRCAARPAGTLIETLTAYFQHGQSLEATARALFVHPNTVRYRLRQAADVTGLSATDAREALTLQLALCSAGSPAARDSTGDCSFCRKPTKIVG